MNTILNTSIKTAELDQAMLDHQFAFDLAYTLLDPGSYGAFLTALRDHQQLCKSISRRDQIPLQILLFRYLPNLLQDTLILTRLFLPK